MTATARLSIDGEKIIFTGYSQELLQFYRSLPNSRFDRQNKLWTCLATPVSAWRTYGRSEFVSTMDDRLESLAEGFHARVLSSKRAAENANYKQPPLRATDAWQHQIEAYWFAIALDSAMLAMDMGTGKSKVAVDLSVNWGCSSVLIICPTSVRAVWRREFNRHSPVGWDVVILEKGTVAKRTEQAKAAKQWGENNCRRVCIVINYESVWRSPFAAWALEESWDCLILDESHRIKAHNSKVSNFCGRLGRRADHRLCLTGTPMPHSPLDLFGQFKTLDPGVFGTGFGQFRQRYAICQNPSIPQQITGHKNLDELHEKYNTLSFRVEAKDVLDLPPCTHDSRTFALSASARTAYNELERELITEVESGVVTVANALVKLLRLQQITSGYLPADDTKKEVSVDDGKANLLADLLADINEPVVVFCWFKHDLAKVSEVAEKLKRRYGELSGRRRDITDTATMSPDVDILAVQVKSGGIGIDLTRARIAICYSLGCISPGDYDQMVARLVRPGQERPVNFYHLIADNTVDVSMYRAREARRNVIDAVLEGFPPTEECINDCFKT